MRFWSARAVRTSREWESSIWIETIGWRGDVSAFRMGKKIYARTETEIEKQSTELARFYFRYWIFFLFLFVEVFVYSTLLLLPFPFSICFVHLCICFERTDIDCDERHICCTIPSRWHTDNSHFKDRIRRRSSSSNNTNIYMPRACHTSYVRASDSPFNICHPLPLAVCLCALFGSWWWACSIIVQNFSVENAMQQPNDSWDCEVEIIYERATELMLSLLFITIIARLKARIYWEQNA